MRSRRIARFAHLPVHCLFRRHTAGLRGQRTMKCLTSMLPTLVVMCATLFPSPLHARPVSQPGAFSAEAVDVDTDALREKLIKGLKAVREDQKSYIRQVVKRVAEKKFPVSIVYASFRYARTQSPFYPFPYFKYALETLVERHNN
ncbi:MAG: hypothetical protein R6U98_30235 [Pirellulaceae bacterium]